MVARWSSPLHHSVTRRRTKASLLSLAARGTEWALSDSRQRLSLRGPRRFSWRRLFLVPSPYEYYVSRVCVYMRGRERKNESRQRRQIDDKTRVCVWKIPESVVGNDETICILYIVMLRRLGFALSTFHEVRYMCSCENCCDWLF